MIYSLGKNRQALIAKKTTFAIQVKYMLIFDIIVIIIWFYYAFQLT